MRTDTAEFMNQELAFVKKFISDQDCCYDSENNDQEGAVLIIVEKALNSLAERVEKELIKVQDEYRQSYQEKLEQLNQRLLENNSALTEAIIRLKKPGL